jgi:hydroxymethylpyrimidine/phosphomethylpyrimidine kinase
MRVVMSVAGSDSGAGAGVQADVKTFAAMGAYGVCVVTAVTAQSTRGVSGIHPVPAEMIARQWDEVVGDFAVEAVKVGMLGGREAAEVLVDRVAGLRNLVVDPVLVASSGARLSGVDAVEPLLAYAKVVTPNRREAGALLTSLTGAELGEPESVAEMVEAAERLAAFGSRAVVVTGSEMAVDVLWHDGRVAVLPGEPVATANSHGSGCTFSSAIAVRLAEGDSVPEAVRAAKRYVTAALRGGSAWRLGAGAGPLNHFV